MSTSIAARIKQLFKLIPEESFEETHQEIIEGSQLKGYNFWLMGFAMIIACIGLNTDSISAVIGAMLISPLMGPIQGFSFGLAINDSSLKKSCIRNWLLMTLISLVFSIMYFLITPFDFNSVQLSSFKSATVFDIALALFGGMAGFVGLIKKEGTKIIAGVAVATACMPPLCTAAYGVAHLDWSFALGGLYFYLINCLFIGLATFLLTRINGFQHKINKHVTKVALVNWLWTLITLAMLVPGIYLAYVKWQDAKHKLRQPTLEERIEKLEQALKDSSAIKQ
jgi:uncharacterized hydrophobic protein (TIGR00271 family)